MEAMDCLQVFFVTKDGIINCMAYIVCEATLGDCDALQWASPSGREEIFTNESFFLKPFRAEILPGHLPPNKEWIAFIEKDRQGAQRIIEQGIQMAALVRAKKGMPSLMTGNGQQPTGLERMIAAMDGKPDPAPLVTSKMSDEEAWKKAVEEVRKFYLPVNKNPENPEKPSH